MKNTYYYIVTLAMLILAFPVKAASEAEFGKLSKLIRYTLTVVRKCVCKRADFVYSCSDEPCVWREFYHLQSGVSDTEDTRFLYSSERRYYCEDSRKCAP